MSNERELLSKILKNWAQEHNANYVIADADMTDEGVNKTGEYLSWIVRHGHANLDLLSLLDRLDVFLENKNGRIKAGGIACKKCKTFYHYGEANQEDGSLLCYSCRNRPY